MNEQVLTLRVSGMLWKRSLVIQDVETNSLWSHLLGRAMAGQLKGRVFRSLPGEMVTWARWKETYPATTVLNLQRSSQRYTKEAFRDPEKFVIGFKGSVGMHHCLLPTLIGTPISNVDAGDLPLLVTFDADSASTVIYDRRVDDLLLTFVSAPNGELRDEQTRSRWRRATGLAVEGKLTGKQLKRHQAIPSFKRAWLTFHPQSRELGNATADVASE